MNSAYTTIVLAQHAGNWGQLIYGNTALIQVLGFLLLLIVLLIVADVL